MSRIPECTRYYVSLGYVGIYDTNNINNLQLYLCMVVETTRS